jgi:hypothetical protein
MLKNVQIVNLGIGVEKMSLDDTIKQYGKQIFYFCVIAPGLFILGVNTVGTYEINKIAIIGLLGGAAFLFNKMNTDLKSEIERCYTSFNPKQQSSQQPLQKPKFEPQHFQPSQQPQQRKPFEEDF